MDNKTDKQLVAGTLSNLCSRCIRLSKNDFIFTAHQRKNNNTITLKIRFAVDDILHFTGLEYLPSIKSILNDSSKGKTRNSRKRALLKMIQNNKFSENNLQDEDIAALNAPHSSSIVPQTTEQYNIYYRINAILTLPQLLNSSEAAKDSYIFNGWDKRTSNIPADFVLSLPSPLHKDERIFLLGVKESSKRNDCVSVKIISVFPDLNTITRGKPKAYKVVSEDIIQNTKTQNIYIDENYKKQLEAEKNQANTATSTNKQHIQTDFNQGIRINGGAAVIDTSYPLTAFGSQPPSLHKIIEKVKSFIKNLVSVSPNTNVHKKTTTPKKKKAKTSAAQQRKKSVKSKTQKSSVQGKKKTSSAQQPKRTQSKPKSVPQQQEKRTAERKEPVYPLSRKKIKEAAAIIKANEQNRAKSQNRSKSRSDNTLE